MAEERPPESVYDLNRAATVLATIQRRILDGSARGEKPAKQLLDARDAVREPLRKAILALCAADKGRGLVTATVPGILFKPEEAARINQGKKPCVKIVSVSDFFTKLPQRAVGGSRLKGFGIEPVTTTIIVIAVVGALAGGAGAYAIFSDPAASANAKIARQKADAAAQILLDLSREKRQVQEDAAAGKITQGEAERRIREATAQAKVALDESSKVLFAPEGSKWKIVVGTLAALAGAGALAWKLGVFERAPARAAG